MISVTALARVPQMVRQAFGDSVLRYANRAAMLDIELIEDRDCFIPHMTMTDFLGEIERRTKERHIGLLVAPHLSFEGYGCWGDYVLSAQTLGEAITRAATTIGFHSCGEAITLKVEGETACFAYFSAARGSAAYPHIATGAAAVMVNLCRSFASPGWKPARVEVDIARPRDARLFEDTFGCPVVFDAPAAAVRFHARLLRAERPRSQGGRTMTVDDLARARLEPASRGDLIGVITTQIWTQVLAGSVSLDGAAHALDLSKRTLQRALEDHGTSFRDLGNIIRARRATELLRGTIASITDISVELGYSTPANFARAFRKATGFAPEEFRRSLSASSVQHQAAARIGREAGLSRRISS
ncbi:AraC family transcriptional regulator [Neotabrizicola shimadae]|uniref:AraC family transcriptional regulator ligand-binding domain-containing protein n=1 Tax=Neotabrizicola shimadae TaxID=2807096 RepID=A0A8G0ZU68_9RHOB|nr:AraC family transcriptional regulator [Neotabrizicola shimadae]QYZ68842.1 AraC family transcriptional regulator ligand-binding domain-containing protein [Neotabrizicola shimadae]